MIELFFHEESDTIIWVDDAANEIFVQSNVLLEIERFRGTMQLSELPLLISFAVIEAVPFAFK